MFDVKLDSFTYDIGLDFENGDFKYIKETLENELNIAMLTNAYDFEYNLGLKQGGFINQEIGNNIWLITLQANITAPTRAEIKEQIRNSLIDYGDVEFSVINANDVTVYLKLNNEQQIIRSFKIV
jgi:hypothetical protein